MAAGTHTCVEESNLFPILANYSFLAPSLKFQVQGRLKGIINRVAFQSNFHVLQPIITSEIMGPNQRNTDEATGKFSPYIILLDVFPHMLPSSQTALDREM